MLGSLTLQQTSNGILEKLMGFIVLLYVGLRVLKQEWELSNIIAYKLPFPVGFLAGFLQGTFGISSPATFIFFIAIKFERPEFITIVLIFLVSISFIQLPTLTYLGLMEIEHFILGCLAVIPLLSGMPLGALLIRNTSIEEFDKVILIVLGVVAIRLLMV